MRAQFGARDTGLQHHADAPLTAAPTSHHPAISRVIMLRNSVFRSLQSIAQFFVRGVSARGVLPKTITMT